MCLINQYNFTHLSELKFIINSTPQYERILNDILVAILIFELQDTKINYLLPYKLQVDDI